MRRIAMPEAKDGNNIFPLADSYQIIVDRRNGLLGC